MNMRNLFLGAFLLLMIVGNVYAASFDCKKAQSHVEKIICGDKGLSQLDESLSKTYQEVMRSILDPSELRREQAKWLREARDLCTESACLEKEYRNRLAALERLLPKKSALCEEFQRLLSQPIDLLEYRVEEQKIEQEDFNFCIPNVDVDGDKISKVHAHASKEEIEALPRTAEGRKRSDKLLVILNAMVDPRPTREIAMHVNVSVHTVHMWVSVYNRRGPKALFEPGPGGRRNAHMTKEEAFIPVQR